MTRGEKSRVSKRERLLTLHRAWIRANLMKRYFYIRLPPTAYDNFEHSFVSDLQTFLHLWYGLLYVVVEGCLARGHETFKTEITTFDLQYPGLLGLLKNHRDGIVHAKDGVYFRYEDLEIFTAEAMPIIKLHNMLGELFKTELQKYQSPDLTESLSKSSVGI